MKIIEIHTPLKIPKIDTNITWYTAKTNLEKYNCLLQQYDKDIENLKSLREECDPNYNKWDDETIGEKERILMTFDPYNEIFIEDDYKYEKVVKDFIFQYEDRHEVLDRHSEKMYMPNMISFVVLDEHPLLGEDNYMGRIFTWKENDIAMMVGISSRVDSVFLKAAGLKIQVGRILVETVIDFWKGKVETLEVFPLASMIPTLMSMGFKEKENDRYVYTYRNRFII